MANQLLTFNPAFMRGRSGGAAPTGTEPIDVHSLNRLVLLGSAPTTVLAVRWPGYDQDSADATLFANLSMTTVYTVTAAVPACSIYGAAGQGLGFDISSHSLSDGWISVPVEGDNGQTIDYPIVVLSGATTDLFRVITADTSTSGTGTVKAQYWDGSAWQDIATLATTISTSADTILDIHWNIADSGGEFTVYVNGSSQASYSGDTLRTADTTIDTVTLGAFYNSLSYRTDYGPMVVSDVDTRNLVWTYNKPTADGTYIEFTGGEAEVDDDVLSSGHSLNSAVTDADGERMSLSFAAINASYDGFAVSAVAIVFAAEAQSDPGLYLKPLVRKSSTDYTPTGSFRADSTSGSNQFAAFTMLTDPSTGSAWADQAAVEACQLGLQASSTA